MELPPSGLQWLSSTPQPHKDIVFSVSVHPASDICVLITDCGHTTRWLKLAFSSSSESPPPQELGAIENGFLVWGKAVRSTYFAAIDVGDERWTDSRELSQEVADYCLRTQQNHLLPSDPPSDDFQRGWYRIHCRDFSRSDDLSTKWNDRCSSLAYERHFSSITVHRGEIYFWCWRSLQALVFHPPRDPTRGMGNWSCLPPYPREFVKSFLRKPHNFFSLSLDGGSVEDRNVILLASRLSENQYTYNALTNEWEIFQHPNFSKNVFNVDTDAMVSCGDAIFWVDVVSNNMCCYDMIARKYLHGPMIGLPMPSNSRSNFALVILSEFYSTSVPTRFCVIWTDHKSEMSEDGEMAVTSTTLHYCILQAYMASDNPDRLVATLVGRVFGIQLPQYFVVHEAFIIDKSC